MEKSRPQGPRATVLLQYSQGSPLGGFLGSPRPNPTYRLISTHSQRPQHPATRSLSSGDSLSQAPPHTGTICRPRTVSHTTCHTHTHTHAHTAAQSHTQTASRDHTKRHSLSQPWIPHNKNNSDCFQSRRPASGRAGGLAPRPPTTSPTQGRWE